jgi:hypothetical protein
MYALGGKSKNNSARGYNTGFAAPKAAAYTVLLITFLASASCVLVVEKLMECKG